MHVSSDEGPVETKVKGMLTISCVIRKLLACSNKPIGFPMSMAQFRKAEILKE